MIFSFRMSDCSSMYPPTPCWEVGYMLKMFAPTPTPTESKNVTKIFYKFFLQNS